MAFHKLLIRYFQIADKTDGFEMPDEDGGGAVAAALEIYDGVNDVRDDLNIIYQNFYGCLMQ